MNEGSGTVEGGGIRAEGSGARTGEGVRGQERGGRGVKGQVCKYDTGWGHLGEEGLWLMGLPCMHAQCTP